MWFHIPGVVCSSKRADNLLSINVLEHWCYMFVTHVSKIIVTLVIHSSMTTWVACTCTFGISHRWKESHVYSFPKLDWAVLSASIQWISINVITLLNVIRVFYRAESVSMRIESTINAENQLLRDQLSRERGLRKQIEADKHELQSQLLESKDRLHHLNSSLKQKDSLMKKLDQVWL